MNHKPIHLKKITLSLFHKIRFNVFSAQIYYGHRIGIVGRNGGDKLTMLKAILGVPYEKD